LIGSGTTPPTGEARFYDGTIPWVNTSELRENVVFQTDKTLTTEAIEELTALRAYPVGTVLFAMYGATIGRVAILGVPATVNQAVCALADPSRFTPRFVFYGLQASREFLAASSTGGGQPNLNAEKVREHKLPCPDPQTQRAIADYLDRETARLDALVAAKERLLGLLAEKRRVLITRAVTRGLDPRAPLRDSGIPWLGEIPAHWGALRLKFLSKEPLAYGANESASEDDPAHPRFVRITDIDEAGNLREDTFRSLPPATAASYLLRDGDILFARSGATVGKVFRYRSTWGAACFAGYLIRLRCNTKAALADFVYAFAQSEPYWGQVGEGTIQATIQNFSAEKYGDLSIAVPPVREQQEILTHIDKQSAHLDAVRSSTERTIALLRERRAALIAAAVTGQLEVG
jgi:restriction endonuclease S subunit